MLLCVQVTGCGLWTERVACVASLGLVKGKAVGGMGGQTASSHGIRSPENEQSRGSQEVRIVFVLVRRSERAQSQ